MKKKLAKGGSMTGGPGLDPMKKAMRKSAGAGVTKQEAAEAMKRVMRKSTGASATAAEKKRVKAAFTKDNTKTRSSLTPKSGGPVNGPFSNARMKKK